MASRRLSGRVYYWHSQTGKGGGPLHVSPPVTRNSGLVVETQLRLEVEVKSADGHFYRQSGGGLVI
jgi:hypothetical protein